MQVRSAAPADAAAIHRVSVASCRAAYEDVLDDQTFLEVVNDPSRVDTLADRLESVATADGVVYLVAEREGALVGFVQCLHGDDRPDHVPEGEAYLKSLYVHPDSWGEGVGTRLLRAVIERLPPDRSGLRLAVLTVNERGKRFYESRGFERVDEGTFETGGVSYDTDVYARALRDT